MRGLGHEVRPVLSLRPGERGPAPGYALAQRVVRPITEAVSAVTARRAGDPAPGSPSALLALLPSADPLWSLRLRQYLIRLHRSWALAAADGGITLFDQAFVQAVGSLALLARDPRPCRVAEALKSVPRPGLLIRVEASRDVLEARLVRRFARQGYFERLLELDLATNLRAVSVIAALDEPLQRCGRPVMSVSSDSRETLEDGVERVARLLLDTRAPADLVA